MASSSEIVDRARPRGFGWRFVAFGVLAALVAGLLSGVTSAGGQELDADEAALAEFAETLIDTSDAQMEAYVGSRARLGFSSEPDMVRELVDSGAPYVVESIAYIGLPLTESELEEMRVRLEFEHAVMETIFPVAQEDSSFAGLSFSDGHDPVATVAFTSVSSATADAIAAASTDLPGQLTVVTATHTIAELSEAMDQLWIRAEEDVALSGMHSVKIDIEEGALRVDVDEGSGASVVSDVAALEDDLGVPLIVSEAPRDIETACNGRADCYSPVMKPGVVVRRGSSVGVPCTAGFWVKRSSTKYHYLTAGHCSWNHGNTNFWHGSNELKDRKATLYQNNGQDIARHGALNSKRTKTMYGSLAVVGNGSQTPTNGLTLTASLGISNVLKVGQVDGGQTTWTGDACSCTINGWDTDWTTISGDSGSPIWHPTGGVSSANAVGINNTTGGRFASVSTSITALNSTMSW